MTSINGKNEVELKGIFHFTGGCGIIDGKTLKNQF
jgi:hypothetical protein